MGFLDTDRRVLVLAGAALAVVALVLVATQVTETVDAGARAGAAPVGDD